MGRCAVGLLLCWAGCMVACGGNDDPAIPRRFDLQGARLEVAWSSYLGGAQDEYVRGLTVDAGGNVYLTGGTRSTDFPVTSRVAQRRHGGAMDVFVTKLDPRGRVVWSTFLGGPGYDRAYAIHVDAAGVVTVAGRAGQGLPTTAGCLQPVFAGDLDAIKGYGRQDGFVARLAADGSQVIWCTYFGGPGRGVVRDMDVGPGGEVSVVLNEVGRPSAHVGKKALFARKPGASDGLVARISADGRRLRWATYLGGSQDDIPTSIRSGPGGDVYVAGATRSADFPVTGGACVTKPAGGEDAFVLRIAADGDRLVFGARLGGEGDDGAAGVHGLAVDGQGRPVVMGYTHSSDFPVTEGAFQRRYGGGLKGPWEATGDLWVARLTADGEGLLACTFLGGRGRDDAEGIQVGPDGHVWVAGLSFAGDFPLSGDACQSRRAGRSDAVLVGLAPDLDRLVYGTWLGGRGEDAFRALAVDARGVVTAAGVTRSRDWPTHRARQAQPGGRREGIVVRFEP